MDLKGLVRGIQLTCWQFFSKMAQWAFEEVPAAKVQGSKDYEGLFIVCGLHFLILVVLDCQSASLSQFLK